MVTHIVGDDHKCAYEGDKQAYKQLVMITNVHMTLVIIVRVLINARHRDVIWIFKFLRQLQCCVVGFFFLV